MSQECTLSRIVAGYRSLFYLWTPSETSFANVEDVPDYVSKCLPLFAPLIFLEMFILHVQGKKDRLTISNDAYSSVSAGIFSLIPRLLMRNIEVGTYVWMYEKFCIYALPWNSPWTWLLCVIVVDFFYYWFHRCSHEISIMWAGHHTHHSSEDYNLTTPLRQGFSQKYFSWLFYLPMAFFIPPPLFVVHLQFNTLFGFWLHTKTINKLGPLEYIMTTPSHHRVHHGVNRYCIDKNFGGVFIVWDRLFGTFEPERDTDELVFGVTTQLHSWNPVYIQTYHWIQILKTSWQMEGVINKVSVFVKGPGWAPGKPRLGCREDIPDVHTPLEKYDRGVSTHLNIYCWFQFLLVLLIYEAVVPIQDELSAVVRWLVFTYVLVALLNIGLIFENRWYAPYVHLVQLISYLLADFYLCSGTSSCPDMLSFVNIGIVASIVITSLRIVSLHAAKRKLSAKND